MKVLELFIKKPSCINFLKRYFPVHYSLNIGFVRNATFSKLLVSTFCSLVKMGHIHNHNPNLLESACHWV